MSIAKGMIVILNNGRLVDRLKMTENNLTLKHILDNSKADSGGERDVNFLTFLVKNSLLSLQKTVLKRRTIEFPEEYYLDRYKKIKFESDRHFLCRSIIQEELKEMGIGTICDASAGDMNILHSNSVYDIALEDFSAIIDVGLTPARNYFRGLTDLKVKCYMITTYFDDYMDDIVFSAFWKADEKNLIDAIKDYEEGFKQYMPETLQFQNSDINPDRPEL